MTGVGMPKAILLQASSRLLSLRLTG